MMLDELAAEMKKDEPKEFVNVKIGDASYDLQLLKGDKTKYRGKKSDTWLFLLNKDKNPCIIVVFDENVAHLENYYYNVPKNCVRIPHSVFFNEFLKPLAKLFGVKKINLDDGSEKHFQSCTVPMIVFALAGKSTFYNKHGFENKKFDAFIEKLRVKSLSELTTVESPIVIAQNGDPVHYELRSRIEKSGYFYKPISTVAEFVIATCNGDSSEEDVALAQDFIDYFKKKLIISRQFVNDLKGGKTLSLKQRKMRGGAKVRESFKAPTPGEAKMLLALRGMLDAPDDNFERNRAFKTHTRAKKRSLAVRKNKHLPPKFRPKRTARRH